MRCTWGKRKERRKSSGKSTQVDGEREGREGDGLSGEVGLGRDFGEVGGACWDFGEVERACWDFGEVGGAGCWEVSREQVERRGT